jgi:hypothetical protein
MAGYSLVGKKLAVLAATVLVPLLAVILYQAVDSDWYARFPSFLSDLDSEYQDEFRAGVIR